MPTEKDIYQHVEAKDASDRVLEKKVLLDAALARINEQNAEELARFPAAGTPEAKKERQARVSARKAAEKASGEE